MDSTARAVCDHHRINTHRVFEGVAARGKTSMGWFDGFTRHLMVNDAGALLACRVTPGHGDERRPVAPLVTGLGGPLFGDRGDIAQVLHDLLLRQGLELLTGMRKHMKHRLIRLGDTRLLRKRMLIETINDQRKNSSQIAHTRHRSLTGFMVNLAAGLMAYSHRPTQPSLGLQRDPLCPMLVM